MDEKREVLVLVEDGDWETVVVALRALGPVTQLLPPRLALVALPAGPRRTEASELPGTAWYEDDLPPEAYDRLSDQEQLFVNAWRARRTPKQRPGNHLPWDAPGHLPPDRPRSEGS
ncbi:hypothetical protein [Streptomyces sp. NPDC058664]|uniref:hypothetical protein n=1 Tax=unclassified Streptomyces TaxID=2593676 RepID=UPI00366542FE